MEVSTSNYKLDLLYSDLTSYLHEFPNLSVTWKRKQSLSCEPSIV
jgi:hypothetical protein